MFMRCLCAGLAAPERGPTSLQAEYTVGSVSPPGERTGSLETPCGREALASCRTNIAQDVTNKNVSWFDVPLDSGTDKVNTEWVDVAFDVSQRHTVSTVTDALRHSNRYLTQGNAINLPVVSWPFPVAVREEFSSERNSPLSPGAFPDRHCLQYPLGISGSGALRCGWMLLCVPSSRSTRGLVGGTARTFDAASVRACYQGLCLLDEELSRNGETRQCSVKLF
jgi:hypothetical protein